jgi:hypothetical protein
MGWIEICRWHEFQHYPDHRNVVWVKNYLRLLHNDDYLNLTAHQRGVLHGLWILYAASDREIADSTATVSRQLGVRVSRATLEALNHAGFITFCASKPLAQNKKLEKEKKVLSAKAPKRPVENSQAQRANVLPKDPAKAIRTMIVNGVITDPVDLEAEITGAHLNSNVGDDLRRLLQ